MRIEVADSRRQVIDLINAKRKSDQSDICRELMLSAIELADLALCARHGHLWPYKYACYFSDKTPSHLNPGNIGDSIRGSDITKKKKAINTIFQFDKERRHIACHMFYTECHDFWHLFYFDQRDVCMHGNHWKHGAHIHYVSDLYCTLKADQAWQKAKLGNLTFRSKEHIRFLYSSAPEDKDNPYGIETNIWWLKNGKKNDCS
jgi:hypothetical protein